MKVRCTLRFTAGQDVGGQQTGHRRRKIFPPLPGTERNRRTRRHPVSSKLSVTHHFKNITSPNQQQAHLSTNRR